MRRIDWGFVAVTSPVLVIGILGFQKILQRLSAPRKANTGRTYRDIPDALAPALDECFAARDLQISEQQANESRHSRRDTVTIGDVFGDDFPFVLPEKGESKANASRHSRRVGGKV